MEFGIDNNLEQIKKLIQVLFNKSIWSQHKWSYKINLNNNSKADSYENYLYSFINIYCLTKVVQIIPDLKFLVAQDLEIFVNNIFKKYTLNIPYFEAQANINYNKSYRDRITQAIVTAALASAYNLYRKEEYYKKALLSFENYLLKYYINFQDDRNNCSIQADCHFITSCIELYQIIGNNFYLDIAKSLVNSLLDKNRFKSGEAKHCFTENFTKTSFHFHCYTTQVLIQLFEIEKNPQYLEAAENSLKWWLERQGKNGEFYFVFNVNQNSWTDTTVYSVHQKGMFLLGAWGINYYTGNKYLSSIIKAMSFCDSSNWIYESKDGWSCYRRSNKELNEVYSYELGWEILGHALGCKYKNFPRNSFLLSNLSINWTSSFVWQSYSLYSQYINNWKNKLYFSSDVLLIITGEIYHNSELDDANYVASIYKKYSENFVRNLDGEFTIILVDKVKNILIASTDIFSTRPLWLHITAKDIAVSNYQSCLTSLGFKETFKLAANTTLTINLLDNKVIDKKDIHKFNLLQHKKNFSDWADAFKNAVNKRVNKGSPKLIVPLSGGHDSGSICCCLNQFEVDYQTISILQNENASIITSRIKTNKGKGEIYIINKSLYNKKYTLANNNLEKFVYKLISVTTGEMYEKEMIDDGGCIGLFIVCEEAKSMDCNTLIAGCGSDEIIGGDYGGIKKYPSNLEEIFPWPNFFDYGMSSYLTMFSYVTDFYDINVKYPFLDKEVVQEFLFLSAENKNQCYKSPLSYFMSFYQYPFQNHKVGFDAKKSLTEIENRGLQENKPTTLKLLDKIDGLSFISKSNTNQISSSWSFPRNDPAFMIALSRKDGVEITLKLTDSKDKRYISTGSNMSFDNAPPQSWDWTIQPLTGYFIYLNTNFISGKIAGTLWLIEYSETDRLKNTTSKIVRGQTKLEVFTHEKCYFFRIAIRLTGNGVLEVEKPLIYQVNK